MPAGPAFAHLLSCFRKSRAMRDRAPEGRQTLPIAVKTRCRARMPLRERTVGVAGARSLRTPGGHFPRAQPGSG